MKVYPLILVLVLMGSQDVLARPGADQRQPRQFFKTLSNVINNFFGVTNAVVQSVFSAQREMIDNFLRETDNDLTVASGFMSDVFDGTQEAAEALDYIREDMFYMEEDARRMARKKKEPIFKMPLPFFPFTKLLGSNLKGITKFADDKLKMLVDMSSQTGKLVADTTKQISEVMKAASKFSKKFEKQKDKFEDTVTKEKLKLIETTKKSLSKFLKDLSKISKNAAKDKDSGKARVILQAENELIDLTRESITGILEETARGIEGAENLKAPKVKKPKSPKPKKKPNTKAKPTNTKKPIKKNTSSSGDKGNMISRMLKQASEKIKVFAKLTKNISKAIEKATKQKRKDLKKAQKEIQKQIKKAQKAKKKIKKDTRKGIKKIMKDEEIAADEITPGVFNATLDNTMMENATLGLVALGENATEAEIAAAAAAAAVRSTTLKPEEDNEADEDIDDAEEESGEDEDEDVDEDDDDDEEEEDDEEEDDDDDEPQDDELDEDADEDDEIESRDLIKEKQE